MHTILFVGDLNEYGRSFQRFRTLKEIGFFVVGLSHTPVPLNPRKDFNIMESISWKLRIPIDLTGVNHKIRDEVSRRFFDFIWIEKGNTIRPSTLGFIKKKSPKSILVSCSEDDMYASHSRSLFYNFGLKYYDVVFTTKTYNLAELKSLGAWRTELFLDSYDEKIHRSYVLTDEEREKFSCDVGFIGSFELDRAEKMLFLAKNGIKVTIWGLDWGPWVGKHPNLLVKDCHLFGDDYSKAICATKINLCFLRKINRDEVTSRSVEIPACGGFMLGERTKRHLEFFEDGKEVVFFDNREELFDLVRKYLKDDEARKRIAETGRERCLKSEYSMRAQLLEMMASLR